MSGSWILEVRARLAEPPAQHDASQEGERSVVLVPLYVEAGELWVRLREGDEGGGELPERALRAGESPWEEARRAAVEVGHEPGTVLRLGPLDELEQAGRRYQPWVGAVPAPREERLPEGTFALPLRVLALPTLVEDRSGPDGTPIRVLHIGRRRFWGRTVQVLDLLLARLGLAISAE